MKKRIKHVRNWEIIGFFWIVIIGSLLHFVFEWSGNLTAVGMISPVNESVWEHLKLGYWSLFFFCLLEYPFIKDQVKGFFLAKAAGIMSLELFIILVYYSYTAILKTELLWIDITSYFIGAGICQYLSYKILNREVKNGVNYMGLAAFIILGLILIIFTFNTPHLGIFMDPNNGQFGIVK